MGGGFQQGFSTLSSTVTVMSDLLNSLPSITLQDTWEMNLQSHALGCLSLLWVLECPPRSRGSAPGPFQVVPPGPT